MKIIVTGSLGNISLPLTKALIAKHHEVIVVSSNVDRAKEIEALGAKAAIGSVTDHAFLGKTFSGADAVYTMVPPPSKFHDPSFDMMQYSETVRDSYFTALAGAGIAHVVNLSSWGAHRPDKTGGIGASYLMEQKLNGLPETISITHIRPTSFYYNMFNFIPMIKFRGHIELNYGGEDLVAVVAPQDIAEAVATELEKPGQGRNVRYVTSDELSCNAIAGILGKEIGIPGLQWLLISDEQAKANLLAAGLSEAMASNVSEIQGAIHKGYLAEDYIKHKPTPGKVRTADFAKEFAAAYRKK